MSNKEKVQEQEGEEKNNLKIVELEKKAQEYLEGWKRAKADYSNLKKESEVKTQETIFFAQSQIIMQLLSVIDGFEKAFKTIPSEIEKSDWVQGMKHIQKQCTDMVTQYGLERIKTVGEKFDPEFHEAVMYEENKGAKKDFIFEEVESGYTIQGKILVAAKVKVAK